MAALRLGRRNRSPVFPVDAPVSLVRPVCGLEPFSEELLTRGFRLAYSITNSSSASRTRPTR